MKFKNCIEHVYVWVTCQKDKDFRGFMFDKIYHRANVAHFQSTAYKCFSINNQGNEKEKKHYLLFHPFACPDRITDKLSCGM